jgi:hypothetical protein
MPERPAAVEVEEVGTFEEDSAAPGTPVFQVENEKGSFLAVAFLPDDVEESDARVFHVGSVQKGDMTRLLNEVAYRWYNGRPIEVVFANVVTEWLDGRDLDSVLSGFERETVEAEAGPLEGDHYDELRGTWDPNYAEEGDA